MKQEIEKTSSKSVDFPHGSTKTLLSDATLILKEIEETIEFYEKAQMEYIRKFNETENKHLLKWIREQIKNTDVAINVLKNLKDRVKSRFA